MAVERVVHFVGIGGIGMSGVARLLAAQGVRVRGSDVRPSRIVDALRTEGIHVELGHRAENVSGATEVVYSTAVPRDNVELVEARRLGLRVRHRAELLGEWLGGAQRSVGVTGTHGKGTVTAMIAWALDAMGLDPGFFVGALGPNLGTNARAGSGPRIAEVDESDGSLVAIAPHVVVLNNLELDHLHYYPTWERLEATMRRFLLGNPRLEKVVANFDDTGVRRLLERTPGLPVVGFGAEARDAVYRVEALECHGTHSRFVLTRRGELLARVALSLPGRYNALNAAGALATLCELGVDPHEAATALARFEGLDNRCTVRRAGGITLVTDYMSHPTGIRHVLETARSIGPDPLWAVFKPYRYTMIRYLHADYRTAFQVADRVVVTEMWTAGEEPIEGIDTPFLCEAIRSGGVPVDYVADENDIPRHLVRHLGPRGTVVFFGGDDLFAVAAQAAALLEDVSMQCAQCPECGEECVEIPEDAVLGEVLDCPRCGAELDLVSLDPPELMPFEEEEK